MRFGLAAALLCLITLSPALADDSRRPPIPISGQSEDFPVFGVSLTAPAGWARDQTAAGGRIVRWAKLDAQGKPETMLDVGFSRSTVTNAQEWKHLVDDLHASSLRSVRTGNNLDGAWVKGNFQSAGMTATQMFVVTREGTRYSAALVHKTPPAPEVAAADDAMMQDFIVHWKWRELEEPSTHLALAEKPIPALGGLIRLNVPAIAQMVAVTDAPTHLQFEIISLKSRKTEMTVELNLQSTPMPDMPQVGRIVKDKLKLADNFEWTNSPAGLGKWSVSQWVKTPKDENPTSVLFGGIAIDDTHSVLVSCTLYRQEATVQRAYWEAVKGIVGSVKAQASKTVP
ncbi:MAG TPA: hypothetical protein VHM90_02970 [Phycisphaerae bacterium]|nr:hypothetical protein [Phycisphaerae bacterium]